IAGAAVVICNDYEYAILKEKTGLDERDILAQAGMLVVTRGEHGSSVMTRDDRADVPAVEPYQIVDPTGVGDAFRAGFIKGMAIGAPPEVCGRIGSVAATFALEHLGGQSHAYTLEDFERRYRQHFGPVALSLA